MSSEKLNTVPSVVAFEDFIKVQNKSLTCNVTKTIGKNRRGRQSFVNKCHNFFNASSKGNDNRKTVPKRKIKENELFKNCFRKIPSNEKCKKNGNTSKKQKLSDQKINLVKNEDDNVENIDLTVNSSFVKQAKPSSGTKFSI